jgi:hypothetical protein
MIFDINGEAPTKQQIDSQREYLKSTHERLINTKQTVLHVVRAFGLIAVFYHSYKILTDMAGSVGTSPEPAMLLVFIKIGLLVATAHLLANRFTQGKLFFIEAHINDLNELSPEKNKAELSKLYDLAIQHKSIHKYLKSVFAQNRQPLFAELYIAEDNH